MIAPGQTILASDFSGLITMWPASSIPSGWFECDGQAISRSTYSTLFGIIGTTYGAGNGTTTFNVPNLQGRFPLGYAGSAQTKVFTFDAATDVDPSTDIITVTSNKTLYNGLKVTLAGASLPTGLSAGDYYVIRISATQIKLAANIKEASARNAINITADGSGSATLTVTFTAHALAQMEGSEVDATVAAHNHTSPDVAETGGSGSGGTSGGNETTIRINDTGETDNDFLNNMPPYTVVKFIIKT